MATMRLLWQVLALAVAGAHAQFDLPYPLQLVRAAPSAVSPQLYGPEPEAVALIRGTTQVGGTNTNQQEAAEEEMTQFHSQDAAGRSLFGYMMADQARIEARAPDGSVRGSYTYLDPSGRAIKVQYWDEGQGFHAAGNHLPATYPGLPQPVRDTPEVEAARKQHLQAYQQVLRRQLQLLYHQQVQEQQQQQQQQQVYQPPPGDSEVVVVESDPAAPPTDYPEDGPGQRYPSLPLVPALYDPSHVHDEGRDAVIVDTAVARRPQQGGFYSAGSPAHRDQLAHYGGHPSGVTNVGGYPPVAMQYLQDIARRADTPAYSQAGTKEAVVLNNLIGRSASSKARSIEVPATAAGEGGKAADPEGRTGATKEEMLAEAVAAGSSKDEHATAGGSVAGEAGRATPGNQQSVVSLKDGPAESYSAMYIYPERQAKAASPKAAAMPQPQVDGGFFYSFHHPVIPVGVQLAQPGAADAADAADADAKAPPRGLSVSQRASLYDAVPVAAVHDAQVPPYLRGAVADHQTKPIFIHYDPAEASAAS